MDGAATPLAPAEFAARLAAIGGFEARPRVAVAVSGGPDSLALILLADRWAREQGGDAHALIVDHGLRPESAADAATVAGWLAARAIAHQVLVWTGDKPASGIQEAAREARYRLLAEWCRAHGVLHLLTAHHRSDQAETHLIRRRAGSGIDGLAAMPAVRELPGCRLVRPLLPVPPARLAALLVQEGQSALSDPSNLNPAFERARLRLGAAASRDRERQVEDAFDSAQACGLARIERERALHRLMARAVRLHPAGFAAIDFGALAEAEPEAAERLLGRVAACIGGARYPARRARLARLRAGLIAEPSRARTLGGCRFVPWRGQVLVLRERTAESAPVALAAGASLVWDGRFGVDMPAQVGTLTLGYLGSDRPPEDEPKRSGLPPLVGPALPALWDERGLAAVPHPGYRRAGVGVLPHLAFCPKNPLTSAGFTVV